MKQWEKVSGHIPNILPQAAKILNKKRSGAPYQHELKEHTTERKDALAF